MKDFKIRITEFDKVLKEALAQTYAYRAEYDNESDFKHELFHQLHALEINGHRLGDKLHGHKTSILHAEARPKAGLNQKADILICDPTIQQDYNYKSEFVIELKKSLNTKDLNTEIDKFAKYSSSVRKLYIASANKPRIDDASIKRTIAERKAPGASVEVLDRSSIQYTPARQTHRRSKAKTSLSERTAKCIRDTLILYGKNRKDIRHSFFWRNYEYHEGDWTFPCEGDFVAQLYHKLRVALGASAVIRTEYRPPSAPPRERVDLFVLRDDETVGTEVKMNYDNICKYKRDDTPKLSRKFSAMSNGNLNHSNFLVVIQGEHAYAKDNKRIALEKLHKAGSDFRLLYYAEHDNKAIGPVSVEEAQELATRR